MSKKLGITLTALVLVAMGCRGTPLVPVGDGGVQDGGDAGPDAGPDAGDAGPDAGSDAGDGGRDGGDAGPYVDAGTCRILDGGRVPAGSWLDNGSCIFCDPGLNPDGWTSLDAGDLCDSFENSVPGGPWNLPFFGACTFDFGEELQCGVIGGRCPGDLPCNAGYCDMDSGFCVLNENRGWETLCLEASDCAQGPCCLDAGIVAEGIPDGGGWCCGLIDGGVQICLDAGSVCYDSSNCCAGLTCVGDDAVYNADVGYGFCR